MHIAACLFCLLFPAGESNANVRVGAAAVAIQADDSMVIGGGIEARYVKGQEGELRATAVVVEKPGAGKCAIVGCDVLFVTREFVDPAAAEISRTCNIPVESILVNATHTHSAPSTTVVHGYGRDETFCKRLQAAIVKAVQEANAKLVEAEFAFRLGEESSVGQNSRLLLKDGTIFWIGPRDDAVRPTGPFDPDLPVLAFRGADGKPRGLIYGHSTHTIGARSGNVRSPSFYGLAAQELERELGAPVCFLEGASGSTHNLSLDCAEMTVRIKAAVKRAWSQAEPRAVDRIVGLKRPFAFRVRKFDDKTEDKAVTEYCQHRHPAGTKAIADVFRHARKVLGPEQGHERTTWLQAVRIGDVAWVGVPAEYFTVLGQEIKRRSPFRYTFVAELANDWIGYLPDSEAFKLGGYQTWMGLHSYAERGTGERVVEETVALLRELHGAAAAGGR